MSLVVDLASSAPSYFEGDFTISDLDTNGDLVVTHNLNGYRDISVWDNHGIEVIPDAFRRINANTVSISLQSAVSEFTGTWHYLIER